MLPKEYILEEYGISAVAYQKEVCIYLEDGHVALMNVWHCRCYWKHVTGV